MKIKSWVLTLAAVSTVLVLSAAGISAQETNSAIAGNSADYVYGYVKYPQIPLFMEPQTDGPQFENYERVRGSAIMVGREYVMPGAILRLVPINEQFGRVVTDATWDVYEKAVVYVRWSDVEPIPAEQLEPLGYLVNPGTQKAIVVVVSTNTVILMEGDHVAYKGNVVVNPRVPDDDPEGTPRGSWLLSQTTVSRDMPGRLQEDGTRLPGYPGVGWAALLSGADQVNRYGYWFHTSSWFDWENLLVEDFSHLRTGGCVSSPTWVMETPEGPMRADQLLWRWVGGNPEASSVVRHRLPELIRVYIVDFEWQLLEGTYARTIRATGYDPRGFHDTLTTAQYNRRAQ